MSYEYRTIFLIDSSTGLDDTTGAPGGIFADKRFIVPTNRMWKVKSVFATLITAGAAGNRQLQLTVSGDTLLGGMDTEPYIDIRADTVQAASVTRYYEFAPFITRGTGFTDTDWISAPIPELILGPNTTIRVFDNAAIGTTAAPDDLELRLVVESRGGFN